MAYIAGYTEGDILVGGETYESFPRLELPIWENWDSTKLYKIGDKVYNEITGSSYVCIKDLEVVNTSTLDIIYWQLIVQGNTENAYEVWLLNGNIGTIEDFFLSIKGEKGEEGYTPQKGIDYFDGIDGINGTNGIDGTNGTNGVDGEQGIQGIQGPPVPIVNNLLEIVSGKALDATQGKIINDSLMSHLSTYAKDKLTSPGTLVASYTHSGNKEVRISAVDVDTNTFTSVAHGLSNGNNVFIVPKGLVYNIANYPTPITNSIPYFVVNKTDNTFQLSLTSGGIPVDLLLNSNLDLNSFHFETSTTSWAITNLPLLYKYKVVIIGQFIVNTGTFSVVPNSKPWEAVYHDLAVPTVFRNPGFALLGGDIYTKIVVDIDFLNFLDIKYDIYAIRNKTSSTFEIYTYSTRMTTKKYNNEKISTLSTAYKYANGTKVEVYSV